MDTARPIPFADLARELTPALLRYLQRYTGNAAVADDLLQETLIRIERGLPGFAERASVKTWAFSIATRVAADHFRQPQNRAQIVAIEEAPEVPDSALSLDGQLVVDEMNACIREVIDSLPEDYRAALILHDLEGLTEKQTAEACGTSLGAAKIRIHRARDRLRQALRRRCAHPLGRAVAAFGRRARSVRGRLRGKPPEASGFVVRGAYRYVRHPLYLSMLLLIWSTPRLSADRLLFNVLWTAWIVIGARLEERDLVAEFGDVYREYQRRVPMLLPGPGVRVRSIRDWVPVNLPPGRSVRRQARGDRPADR